MPASGKLSPTAGELGVDSALLPEVKPFGTLMAYGGMFNERGWRIAWKGAGAQEAS